MNSQYAKKFFYGVLRAAGIGILPLLVMTIAGCNGKQSSQPERATTSSGQEKLLSTAEEAFLARHWPSRIAAQGPVPPAYSKLEASLKPGACGSCHQQQYADWQTSLHSHSMGPGVLGQLLVMDENDPLVADSCRSCHTPLAEQRRIVSGQGGSGHVRDNEQYDPGLQRSGLVCAGCHVRRHQRYGPPRSGAAGAVGKIDGNLPHNGFTAETAFTKSAFCRGCHQFTASDLALNGKLIENTYEEWRVSGYPEQGRQCQSCHMPGRRHLWRGIHDPDTVRKGVNISVALQRNQLKAGGNISATITVSNAGVGHYFPTYVTPKVLVHAVLLDVAGREITASAQEAIIGRELALDLSKEIYDTRIAPHDSLAIQYSQAFLPAAARLKVSVTVEPDHFYARFFQTTLDNGTAGQGRALLEKALDNARHSSFSIFEQVLPLVTASGGMEQGNRVPPAAAKRPSQQAGHPPNGQHGVPDWNAKAIHWYGYNEGLRLAKASGKPMLMILYADWCPTCHAYKHIFRDPAVIAAAREFVMVRVNVDKEPRLSQAYRFDGEYVPRTFALTPQGKVIHNIYPERSYARYFLSAEDPAVFRQLMERVQRELERHS